jgi:UrcA family protein
MFLKTTIATLAAASMFAAAAAQAGPYQPDSASVTIRSGDLNLNTEAGARVALQRIEAAAHVVCGPQPDQVDLRRGALYAACVKTTVARSVTSLGNPIMARLNGSGPTSTAIAEVR